MSSRLTSAGSVIFVTAGGLGLVLSSVQQPDGYWEEAFHEPGGASSQIDVQVAVAGVVCVFDHHLEAMLAVDPFDGWNVSIHDRLGIIYHFL